MKEITITNIDTKEEKIVNVAAFSEEMVLEAIGGGVVIGEAFGMFAVDSDKGERLMVCLN
jgi:hypothetical protein